MKVVTEVTHGILGAAFELALTKHYRFKPVNLSDSNIWITVLRNERKQKFEDVKTCPTQSEVFHPSGL